MNNHRELLKVIGGIDEEMIDKIFCNMLVHAPKAVLDAYNRINKSDEEEEVSTTDRRVYHLQIRLKAVYDVEMPAALASNIVNILDTPYKPGYSSKIAAIKKLRSCTGLGLKDAKELIDAIE